MTSAAPWHLPHLRADLLELGRRYVELIREVASADMDLARDLFGFHHDASLTRLLRFDEPQREAFVQHMPIIMGGDCEHRLQVALHDVALGTQPQADALAGQFSHTAADIQFDFLCLVREVLAHNPCIVAHLLRVSDRNLLSTISELPRSQLRALTANHRIFLQVRDAKTIEMVISLGAAQAVDLGKDMLACLGLTALVAGGRSGHQAKAIMDQVG